MYVSDVGIKLYLKKVEFGHQRDDTMEYHLQTEAIMLRMYAKLLVEMLTNREDAHPEEVEALEIDPEIKCILYECYHAKDTTEVKEHERYEQEIARYIQMESEKENGEERRLVEKREEFKEQVENDKKQMKDREESNLVPRTVKRKPD